MQGNNVIKKGNSTAGNCQTRKLIKAIRATSSSLDTTIEFDGLRPDIFVKGGKYGVTVFIRSKFSYTRFFPVLYSSHTWKCTCGDPNCLHVKRAIHFLGCEN